MTQNNNILLNSVSFRLSAGDYAEGSGCFNNAEAAIDRVDSLIDPTGAGFASQRIKSGVMTIIDEALSCLEEHTDFAFTMDDLLDIRDSLEETLVLK